MQQDEMPEGDTCRESLEGRRVTVIGAGGFIGRRLSEFLARRCGAKVTALVRHRSQRAGIAELGAVPVLGDLRDEGSVAAVVDGAGIVFNLAYNFRGSARENLKSFGNLLGACRRAGVERLMQTSSIAVYDEWPGGTLDERSPRDGKGSVYKETKREMECQLSALADEGALSSVIVQPTIVYGPHSWLWTDLIAERLLTGTVVLPRDTGFCPAVYVDDVVQAMILAGTRYEDACDTFIVSGSEAVDWGAYYKSIATPLGTDRLKFVEAAELPSEGRDEGEEGKASRLRDTVQAAMSHAMALTGPRLRGRMQSAVLALRRKRGGRVHVPGPGDLALLRSRGAWDISKARSVLGYEPRFDFSAGSRLTAEYLVAKYGRA